MPLRLKSLELHGYKTFAAQTSFEFAAGITAIVGPNGSGKSNIADSLRWVLGEQSYTLLRGKKTEDMIFSGSEQRPRAGMASAEIIFDNNTGWLPVDFSEVAITRRAYRDGHNDYLLNGQVVRLRDMNELLAASGLSERTYTILGQGLVDASLALKADDRRRLFEEAAGVGLYRIRREEATKRLESTRHNLDRVLDILAELEPRLKTLERQAKRANEYGAAQAQLRELLSEWYGYHWHHAQQELTGAREAAQTQELRVQELRQAHSESQTKYSSFREDLSALRAHLNSWHHESSELHLQREEVSRGLAVLEERRHALISSLAVLELDQERALDEEKLARSRFREVEGEADRLQTELNEAQARLRENQEALQQRQAQQGGFEEQLEAARMEKNSLHARKAESQARLDDLNSKIESGRQKLEFGTVSIRSAEASVEQARHSFQIAQDARIDAGQTVENSLKELNSRKIDLEKLDSDRHSKLEEKVTRQGEYSRAQAQLDILLQAEESLAGYAEGSRFLLDASRRSRLGAKGALSSILDVPPELETAIAAALGDSLDAVLLEASQVEEALRLLESDDSGRAALLPTDVGAHQPLQKPEDPGYLGLASDLVQSPVEYEHAVTGLLGQTLVVQDRAAARRMAGRIPLHARVVTLRGEVFRGDGLIIAGKSTGASTLSRPRQKRELGAALAQFGKRLEALNRVIEELSGELSEAERAQSSRSENLEKFRADYERAQSQEQKETRDLDAAVRQSDWLRSQNAELQSRIEQDRSEADRYRALVKDIDAQIIQSDLHFQGITNQISELSLVEAQDGVAYWNTRLAVITQAVDGERARQMESMQLLERAQLVQKNLQERKSQTDQQIQALDGERSNLHDQEAGVQAKIEAIRTELDPAESQLQNAERQENLLQESETSTQRNLMNSERTWGQLQLEQIHRQESVESLREKITDDFGLVSFEYEENVEGPVPLPFEGLVEQLPQVLELSAGLEARLNLTRREFSRTYEAVDKQFRAIFTRLFGGGSAHLALTDPDNLIETGIEIEARLPGRREQGLSLLSGGERSLTAIALVFALLKVSPTPVCVMDAVDAMLDEANVGRFRDLLVDLSRDTQFIIITHNRNTVQAADVIYGVTMGRDSVTQIISLKLDEVSEEMLGTSQG